MECTSLAGDCGSCGADGDGIRDITGQNLAAVGWDRELAQMHQRFLKLGQAPPGQKNARSGCGQGRGEAATISGSSAGDPDRARRQRSPAIVRQTKMVL